MLVQAPLAAQRLQEANLLAPGASPESVLEQLKPELFQGVETSRLEVAARKKEYRSLEPRVTDLSGRGCRDADHLVVSFSAVELLTQRLQQDSEFRRKCHAKSEEWKKGDRWRRPPTTTIANFDDAVAARFHPRLMRPATADEEQDFRNRIALEFNADDIEVPACALARPRAPSPCLY